MNRRVSIPVVVFLVVTAMFVGTQYNSLISGDTIYDQLRKFTDVISLTERYYVEEVNTPELVEEAIRGMLTSLDPHSVYIPAKQMQRVQEEFRGAFEGIGIQFDIVRDTIYVVAPIIGGPSDRLGIQSGDRIVKIDGESAIGLTNEDVLDKLRGPKGTRVTVEIIRGGIQDPLEFEIIRDKIPLYSVSVSLMVDSDVGYILVNRFSATTHTEFVQALEKLRNEGMRKLILDLRQNPGGYLEEAFKMADLFIPQGKKIVYTKGRTAQANEEYIAMSPSPYEEMPLIILINTSSASASEIVAGAVQDWDRGLIVGERSFGKGLVQRQFDLRDGSAFRLTTAKYYTPSGRLIQRPYDIGNEAYRLEAYYHEEVDEDAIPAPIEPDTTQPIYHTAGGRTVYGGGGITPDVIVRGSRWTELGISIVRKNLFRIFNSQYMDKFGDELREKYQDNLVLFRDEYIVSEDVFDDFIAFVKENGIEVKDDQLAQDKPYIKAWLKSEIGQGIFGTEGAYVSRLPVDEQFQRALTLFPDLDRLISAEVIR